MGVYELLEFDDQMLDALRANDHAELDRLVQNSSRFRSLSKCALENARDGLTTLEEVFRVSAETTLNPEDDEPATDAESELQVG
jgi:MSHA biogenesis protein MshE